MTGTAVTTNAVSFRLLSLPGSVNEIYQFGYTLNSPRPQKRLKPEWSIWATNAKPHIPLIKVADMSIIRIDRCYHYPFFYSNGRWRKFDSANLDKLLFDIVSQKIQVDDSRFKQGLMDSQDSEQRYVAVTLTEVTEAQWRTTTCSNTA